jgi:hypothetical protein
MPTLDTMTIEEKRRAWGLVKAGNPEMATMIEEMRETFGAITVTHIKVGEQEFGSPTQPEDCFPFTPAHYDHEAAMLKWKKTIQDANVKKQALAKEAKAATRRRKR